MSQEFEQEMERMKTKLESIKASREEVQKDIKKLRSHFKEQMAVIANPRKQLMMSSSWL